MPRIFDNIEQALLPALRDSLSIGTRADFCVGYFNLRGWKQVDGLIENWEPENGQYARVLVGMQNPPKDELRSVLSHTGESDQMDNKTAVQLRKKMAQEFREQLTVGIPTAEDEAGLRRLAAQIRAGQVKIKLYLRHRLHAKLYLVALPHPLAPTQPHPSNPLIGYLGSSNLTFAGLSEQGELNTDVTDYHACEKLAAWFEERWNDRFSLDISEELAAIIEESWARESLIPPYHIYVKMAYHLSQDARAGLATFDIPKQFDDILFDFQKAAVKIAAHHVNRRGGVIIGDVVGLGKTLMATTLASILEETNGWSTLIICPPNLIEMWQWHVYEYGLRAKVLSLGKVNTETLADIPGRFRLLVLDESHNFRNREGKRYRALQEYVQQTESRVVMLSATPYNKTYLDLSNQLRLFVPEERDLGIRPEHLLRSIGEAKFSEYQVSPRTLAAFEKSEVPDDWRELMRLFLVRRTRSFIQNNYAATDEETGRQYLLLADGKRSYFPDRVPKAAKFRIQDGDLTDQYARMYADRIVDAINSLNLPRYGLGNYVSTRGMDLTSEEKKTVDDLGRAGKRLMGFCRTNLFKRLESSGRVFIQSVERHILRNHVYLYALEQGLPVPIGTQHASMLDTRFTDEDADATDAVTSLYEDENSVDPSDEAAPESQHPGGAEPWGWDANAAAIEKRLHERAAQVYRRYKTELARKFRWLPSRLFRASLRRELIADCATLLGVLRECGAWDPQHDSKLEALVRLLKHEHPNDKVLVFTQFADTVIYLESQLAARGVTSMAGVTGGSSNPTAFAQRFSPVSNGRREQTKPEDELRVLIATDVLSEGQNLQDCSVVVNYDLPWAIIRLIQRVGRVDRIGQKADTILAYTFLPAQGVERIIRLRERIRHRLKQNAEVVGTDEAFFEDDLTEQTIFDLYSEKSGILDGDADGEVDLASYSYQIWHNAITENPALKRIIPALPDVVHATKEHTPNEEAPEGALVYMRTPDGTDALAWMDKDGQPVTQSQFTILKLAECRPDAPALPRLENHYELVARGVERILQDEHRRGGGLGRPSGARYRVYTRLMDYAKKLHGTLFDDAELRRAIDDIYAHPLRQSAVDILNRRLKNGVDDEELAQLVIGLRREGRLSVDEEEEPTQEPQIICSMGLSSQHT